MLVLPEVSLVARGFKSNPFFLISTSGMLQLILRSRVSLIRESLDKPMALIGNSLANSPRSFVAQLDEKLKTRMVHKANVLNSKNAAWHATKAFSNGAGLTSLWIYQVRQSSSSRNP